MSSESTASNEIEASVRDALETVGGVWPIMVLTCLGGGAARYRDLKAGVEGINDRMLSQTLQRFVRDGLVHRRQVSPTSNAVEYELTEVGHRVTAAMCEFVAVMRDVAPTVHRSRAASDEA